MTTNEGNREVQKKVVGDPKPSPIKVGPGGAARTPIVVKPGGLTITAGGLSSELRSRVANVEIPGPDIEISEDESHHLADLYNELFDYEEVFAYLNIETGEEEVVLVNLPIPTRVIEFLHGNDELVTRVESTIGVTPGHDDSAPHDRIPELYQQIFKLLEGLAKPTTSS